MARPLVIAGTITSVVGMVQLIFLIISLCQYGCLVDVLRHYETLLFIKILYFNKPTCYSSINIGSAVPGMDTIAFVYINREPRPTARTFTINGIYVPLILIWIVASAVMVVGCARNRQSKVERYIWLAITSIITVLDIVVVVLYATDLYSTATLTELVRFIGGSVSGVGNTNDDVNTSLAAIIMVVIYGRFGLLILINVGLMCWVLSYSGIRVANTVARSVSSGNTFKSSNGVQQRSAAVGMIPRANLLPKLSSWFTGGRQQSSAIDAFLEEGVTSMPRDTSTIKSPVTKNSVTFPDNLLSLPTRLASILSERQHQLEECVVDTSMRSPARGAAALPDSILNPTVEVEEHETPTRHHDPMGRRGTAAELQGQLPWSYIPPSAHRMRDNLPEDEDLPPVPVPDYTVDPKYRKASVHRAGSSVSLMRNVTNTKLPFQTTKQKTTKGLNPLNHLNPDVLY